MPMQHQLPQIPLLTVRCPQPRKAPFHQQLQNVGCVPLVGLLLAHVTGPDLRCIPDPDCVPQILYQFHEPLAVARGLHADQRRPGQCLIELLRLTFGMHQLLLSGFSRFRVQPTHLLPAGMKITAYNHPVRKLLLLLIVFGPQPKDTLG